LEYLWVKIRVITFINSKFFEKCGDIESVRIIYDKETNKSKGFGYVQFENSSSLLNAIQLNSSELDGRNIKVDNANKWFRFHSIK